MTKPFNASSLLLVALAAGIVGTQVGCRSASGSRWASLNPWSKSTAAAAETAVAGGPKLPSDGATPLIEGAEATLPTAPAVASLAPPATTTSPTPASEAANSVAVPKIETPATAFASKSTPSPESTTPAATPTPPAAAIASSGPYDPDGYKPSVAAPAESPTGGDRYGLGSRYASAPSVPSGFEDMPPIAAAPAAPAGDRYGAAPPAADRYAAAPPVTPPSTTPEVESLQAPSPTGVAAVTPYPSTTPEMPAASAYPVASATPTAADPYPETGTIGTLPAEPNLPSTTPSASVYAATPVTPEQPAAASPTSVGSTVRLTSLPGEYRPGGTGTYRPRVNVAANPSEDSDSASVSPAAYPTTVR